VIEQMPADMLLPLPLGYVLLDARKDRPLRAWAAHLEFRDLTRQELTAPSGAHNRQPPSSQHPIPPADAPAAKARR
jgi:hypothetical protein